MPRFFLSMMLVLVLGFALLALGLWGVARAGGAAMALQYGQFAPADEIVSFYYLDVERNLAKQRATPLEAVMFDEPAMMQDGRQVITAQNGGSIDLYVVDGLGASMQITDFSDFVDDRGERASRRANILPAWSPDGQWIAFVSNDLNGRFALYIVRPDGSGLREINSRVRFPNAIPPQWVGLE